MANICLCHGNLIVPFPSPSRDSKDLSPFLRTQLSLWVSLPLAELRISSFARFISSLTSLLADLPGAVRSDLAPCCACCQLADFLYEHGLQQSISRFSDLMCIVFFLIALHQSTKSESAQSTPTRALGPYDKLMEQGLWKTLYLVFCFFIL